MEEAYYFSQITAGTQWRDGRSGGGETKQGGNEMVDGKRVLRKIRKRPEWFWSGMGGQGQALGRRKQHSLHQAGQAGPARL